ncbi:hypothetical protein HaLaN_05216, partial [Haematococcus lacustris]
MAQPDSAVSSTSTLSAQQFALVVGCVVGGLLLILCITACAVLRWLGGIDKANAADIKARLALNAAAPAGSGLSRLTQRHSRPAAGTAPAGS